MITQIPNCMNGARTLKIHQDGAVPGLHRPTSTTGDIRSCIGRKKHYEDSWLHSAGWLIRVIKRTRRREEEEEDISIFTFEIASNII